MRYKTISPLALPVTRPRDVRDRTKIVPHGVCIHTTGRGIVARAIRNNADVEDFVLAFYQNPRNAFPHYVIDWEGFIYNVADERERAAHAGVSKKERQLYLSGKWKKEVSKSALERWEFEWSSAKKSPSHLYPSRSPNNDYIGIELIPATVMQVQSTKSSRRLNGNIRGWFFSAQYAALGKLTADIFKRYYKKPVLQARKPGTIVCHEDLEPLTRWNRAGGWDPGYLRATPRFDMTYFSIQFMESLIQGFNVEEGFALAT